MREITLVLPHFMNKGMLIEQQKVWADYPPELRARLHVVVVDDCSPKGHRPSKKSVLATGVASLRIYRLLSKKRWNWLACRNLGAKVATTDWLLLTDIDHAIPAETLRDITEDELRADDVYRFRRVTVQKPWPWALADQPDYKPHNDSWLMTRSLFFSPAVGGYDERLSGCYGTSGEFSDRLRAAARAVVMRTSVIVRYPREIIADASTHPEMYSRKGDPLNDDDLQRRKEARSKIVNWKPLHGLVKSELVYDSSALAVAV